MKYRTLILMRHAKSSWANASQADFDRPLNDRGRTAAPMMGGWLAEHHRHPDWILCSTACRAQQTAELVMSKFGSASNKIDLDELYLASPVSILKAIADRTPEEARSILVVGHNPGLEDLASALAGRLIVMTTAAIAIFEIHSPDSWSITDTHLSVSLKDFSEPKKIQPTLDLD